MIAQNDHKIVQSFVEFIDYKILQKGVAFSNVSSEFYLNTGVRNTAVNAYHSPYKRFIYNSDIASAISGFSGDGVAYSTGTSGFSVDFLNGRILTPSNVSFSRISGSYSAPDIYTKYTTKSEANILLDTKYVSNKNLLTQSATGIDENTEVYPIIYLQYSPNENEPRALGGMDKTQTKFTAYVVADSPFLLDGVLSILRDTNHLCFGVLAESEFPLNISGDLKNSNYSYTGTANVKSWPNTAHIERVRASKVSLDINSQMGQKVFIGIADFDISQSRYPRQ